MKTCKNALINIKPQILIINCYEHKTIIIENLFFKNNHTNYNKKFKIKTKIFY